MLPEQLNSTLLLVPWARSLDKVDDERATEASKVVV